MKPVGLFLRTIFRQLAEENPKQIHVGKIAEGHSEDSEQQQQQYWISQIAQRENNCITIMLTVHSTPAKSLERTKKQIIERALTIAISQ